MIFTKSSSVIEVSPKKQRPLTRKNSQWERNNNDVLNGNGAQQKNGATAVEGSHQGPGTGAGDVRKGNNDGPRGHGKKQSNRRGKGRKMSSSPLCRLYFLVNSRFSSSKSRGQSSVEAGERDEVRAALLRHWTSLDRARLHTFHLWLVFH